MLWLPAARADPTRWRPHSMSLSSTLPDTHHGLQRDGKSNRSLQRPEASWLNALICRCGALDRADERIHPPTGLLTA
jgi:hypothetical protein